MLKAEKQFNWLQLLIVFLLGLLIAGNVFLYLNIQSKETEIANLKTEVAKLKSDDLALAQVINNVISQLQALRILPSNQTQPKE